jgi:hypothetical protein
MGPWGALLTAPPNRLVAKSSASGRTMLRLDRTHQFLDGLDSTVLGTYESNSQGFELVAGRNFLERLLRIVKQLIQ